MNRLLAWDARISDKLRIDKKSGPLFFFVKVLAHSGDSWLWCGFLFLLWLFADGGKEKSLAFWGGSIALTALLVFFLKKLLNRKRPEGEWGTIYRKGDPYSFPSGHAVRGGLIVMLSWGTFHDPLITSAVFLWAVCMSLSRVLSGLHYVLDVLGGFFLGLLIGWGWIAAAPWIFQTFPLLFNKAQWFGKE